MAQAAPALAQPSSRPHQLAVQQTLPGVQLITDMNRAFFLAPDRQRGLPQRRLGYGIIGDGVRLLVPPGGETARYLEDERLVLFDYTTIVGNTITPIVPPFPGGPPREITELPQILNADEVIAAIAAEYPADLRARGLGGTVGMQFLIGEAGEVRNIRVIAIAAYDALTTAAGRVAQVYRFSPGRAGDEYVTLWVSHAIDFRAPSPQGASLQVPQSPSDRERLQSLFAFMVQRREVPVDALLAVPSAAADADLRALLTELTAAREEVRVLRDRFSDDYPPIQTLLARIETIERQELPGVLLLLMDGLR
jgi:TonB family protein